MLMFCKRAMPVPRPSIRTRRHIVCVQCAHWINIYELGIVCIVRCAITSLKHRGRRTCLSVVGTAVSAPRMIGEDSLVSGWIR